MVLPFEVPQRTVDYDDAEVFKADWISSRIPGSSIVAGIVQGSPPAIFFIVPRRILPERVFGRRATVWPF